MELGLYTFAELMPSPVDGTVLSTQQRMRNLIEEMRLADEVGLDVFGLGEHHRPDFVVSSPTVALAAGAEVTERIRLSSAVTVLSSDDPIRVFQDFATLDLLSGGRAEIMAGRGSFTESFPLFGYDLADYDDLFAEKLQLLLALRESETITWPGGRHTPRIEARGVYPRPVQERIPVWIAVGGNPGSATRAGSLGLPMAIAIIGGEPARFAPFAELHRQAAAQAGYDDPFPALSINSHGYIAKTSQEALDDSWPYLSAAMNKIGRERGWPPTTREQFDQAATLHGAHATGSPQQVIEKIMFQYEIFRHDRFTLMFTLGGMPHDKTMHSIELFGNEVAPVVRAEIARANAG